MKTSSLFLALILFCTGCSRSKETYFSQGQEFFRQKKFKDASVSYKRAIQKDNSYREAYLGFARSEIELKRLDRAVPALRRAITLSPNDTEARVLLADLYLAAYMADSGRPVEFLNEVRQQSSELLRRNSQSYDGLRLTGYLLTAESKPAEARQAFEKAETIKPGTAEVAVALGQMLISNNDSSRAEGLLKQAIQRHPTESGPYRVLYLLYMGTSRQPEAEALLRRQMTESPDSSDAILQMAAHYVQLGRPAAVNEVLSPLIEDEKRFRLGAASAADFLLRTGRTADAVKILETASERKSENRIDLLKRLADTHLKAGATSKALLTLDRILKEAPEDQNTRASRADLLVKSAEPQKIASAVAELSRLVEEEPDNPSYRLLLAQALLARDDRTGATGHLREAVRRGKDFVPARLLLTELALTDRRFGEVLRYADEILQLQANNHQAMVLKAAALSGLGRPAEAKPLLKQVLTADPRHKTARIELALLTAREGRIREAESDLLQQYETDRADVRPLRAMITLVLAQKQATRAIEYLSQEVARSPSPDAVRVLLAETAVQTNNTDVAIDQFSRVAFGNRKQNIKTRIAELQFRKGNVSAALNTMKEVIAEAPADTNAATTYATLLEMAGQLKEAEALYRKALQLDAANVTALNNLAFLLANSGTRLDEAQEMAEKVTRRDPRSEYSDTLGWIYLKKGLHDSAIQIFSKAVAAEPKTPVYRYHLAMAYKAKGDFTKAKSELTLALNSKPSGSDEQQIRQLLTELN